ncbi:branched-chain amino acid transport system II carrier protein [Bacillus paranthracis]
MRLKKRAQKTKKDIMIVCAKATLIVASILAMIYSALSFMGASSVAKTWSFR